LRQRRLLHPKLYLLMPSGERSLLGEQLLQWLAKNRPSEGIGDTALAVAAIRARARSGRLPDLSRVPTLHHEVRELPSRAHNAATAR